MLCFHVAMTGASRTEDVTALIRLWREGDREAGERLFRIVLPELRLIAERLMKRDGRDHALQPTELVNQVYQRLSAARDRDWQDRRHFFAVAARAMRHVLIDHARSRPDADFQPVESALKTPTPTVNSDFLLNISKLLDDLSAEHPEWCSIIELKYFMGLTDDEAAEILRCPARSLQRRWQDARRWLFERLCGAAHGQYA